MRTGCGCGCLTFAIVGFLALGTAWFVQGAFVRPEVTPEIGDAADGRRAQQKLFELSGRMTARGGGRRAAVTFSDRELNALLARHVGGELPLASPAVRFIGNGTAEVIGRLPVHALLGDPVMAAGRRLGDRWTGQGVWLRVRGHVGLESGAARGEPRRIRLEPEAAWLGSRRVPVALLRVLPDGPAKRALRWPVPATVDSVLVEAGRLTLTSRP